MFKGSISIEGISLTVAKLEKNRCTIAIIPHTVELTNLGSLKPGDPVNLEADVIAKYVEKMMNARGARDFAERRGISTARVLRIRSQAPIKPKWQQLRTENCSYASSFNSSSSRNS